MLRLSCLEKLFDTGKTLCDILTACDTARMEGTHGKLCTRLTDGLSCDNTNCFTDSNGHTVGKVGAVALSADAMFCTAVEDGADLYACCA